MIVSINRSIWRFGGESEILTRECGMTQMLNSRGFLDVLGFLARESGIPDTCLLGIDGPAQLKTKHGRVIPYIPRYDLISMMDTNDGNLKTRTPLATEGRLENLIEPFGLSLEFKGQYHPAVLEELQEARYE